MAVFLVSSRISSAQHSPLKLSDDFFKYLASNFIIFADTFEEAMNIAKEKARPGDAVLLSPACASWGMFKNYEVRGKVFKEIVRKFKG